MPPPSKLCRSGKKPENWVTIIMNQQLVVESPNFLQTVPAQGALTSITADKAVAEVQAMLTIAKRFPRDEARAYQKVQTACQRPMLAEAARYTYNRGGSEITGPSIRLAEAIAQLWGNITWGWKEIERGRDISTCQAYAWDMENNVRREADFQVPHYRDTRSGRKPLKDDRDIYEMCANMAARRVRACLLNVIPGDITEMAEQECDSTLSNNEKVTPETVKKMLEGLAGYSVTRAQVEKRIGRSMDAITPGQMVSLRRVYVGLRDGMGKVEDYFEIQSPAEGVKAEKPQQGVDAVKDKLKAKKPDQPKGDSPQREDEKQLHKESVDAVRKKMGDMARQIVEETHQEEEARSLLRMLRLPPATFLKATPTIRKATTAPISRRLMLKTMPTFRRAGRN
jgi:hypothetical protein